MGLCCWIEYFQSFGLPLQVGVALACILGGVIFFQKLRSRDKSLRRKQEWNNVGKDVVVLHMFNRARDCPNPSPFPLKLETWLRVNKVKYVTDFEEFMSKKGKSPWITLNGQEVTDSQLSIEHIAKELGINDNLTPTQKAQVQLCKEILRFLGSNPNIVMFLL